MITTSLKKIFECGSWLHDTPEFTTLMKAYGKTYQTIDDNPIPFSDIERLTNLTYSIDCTSSRSDCEKIWRSFALWCASQLQAYINEASCQESITTAAKYLANQASFQEICEIFEKSSRAAIRSEPYRSVHYYANQLASHVSNPTVDHCISDSFNTYALGMFELGQEINDSEILQRVKFLQLIE